MIYATQNTPDLEDRFLQPPNWRWHAFTREDRTLRFGSVFPKDKVPDAIVVCLPGLGEYAEKYFEIARNCLDKNLAFWVIDWAGQGRSTRYLNNPHKRHSADFQEDVEDLHYFVMEYIKHASVHPDVGRIPLSMLAHSMGANIGMHYLSQHSGLFECAAFTAPMFGLKVFQSVPLSLALLATSSLNALAGKKYAPGDRNWSEGIRANAGSDIYSSDAVRGGIHNSWCASNPDLQVGNLTYGWLHQATKSCNKLLKKKTLASVDIKCLIATAGKDTLVNNETAKYVASTLKNAELIDYPDAQHEILMEGDSIRGDFMEHFYKLTKECIIDKPETLKPF